MSIETGGGEVRFRAARARIAHHACLKGVPDGPVLRGMTTEPIELDSDLVTRVRAVTEDVRGLVESAIRRELDDRAFSRLLEELEAETGPLPEELVAEAERFWHAS